MSDDESVDRESGRPRPYIDGYFTRRVESGERPKYGYPSNHVPETTNERMNVVTGFMAGRKSK